MKSSSSLFIYLLIGLCTCIIIISLLSLIHDLKYWYFKILDFPRLQYFIMASVFFLLFLFFNKKWKFPAVLLLLGLLASIWIQGRVIFPYYLGNKAVPEAKIIELSEDRSIRILIANVLITNKDSKKFIEIVKKYKPDLLLVMEVDQWWIKELQIFRDEFRYAIEYPLNNAYGMALYSKLPLENEEILFFNHEDVPSFIAEVILESGKSFSFIGVHPVAPVPSDRYPDNVGEKEVALIKVGEIVAERRLPVIVAGDFNDVSWSNTSRLFEDQGDLRNVRIGRGIYSTFDAQSLYLRWPLDHFFVTREFSLLNLERLPKFGSDHFPLFAEFVLPL